MGKVLKKEVLNKFISNLMSKFEVIAPVKTDIARFQVITGPEQVCFDENPMMPLKKFFMEKELFAIKGNSLVKPGAVKPKIVFGARLCDLNGIRILDSLFLDEPVDEHYKAIREKMLFIGLNCKEPLSEHCFCESMKLEDYYDLMLHDMGDSYYIDIGTEKGRALVKNLKDFEFDIPRPKCEKKLNKKDIQNLFDERFWKSDAEQCVSCQRCTNLCPTCLCFDIKDEMDATLSSGIRKKLLDSCHSKDFSEVAGGYVFRDARIARYMHRIFHKTQWFKDKYGIPMCTGCGRCIQYCHSKIDWVKTINES